MFTLEMHSTPYRYDEALWLALTANNVANFWGLCDMLALETFQLLR